MGAGAIAHLGRAGEGDLLAADALHDRLERAGKVHRQEEQVEAVVRTMSRRV